MSQQVLQVAIDHQPSGATLVAGITGYRHEIIEALITADATGRVKLAAGATVLCALEVVAGGGGIKVSGGVSLTDYAAGVGQGITLVTTNSANVSGYLIYKQVPVIPGV